MKRVWEEVNIKNHVPVGYRKYTVKTRNEDKIKEHENKKANQKED